MKHYKSKSRMKHACSCVVSYPKFASCCSPSPLLVALDFLAGSASLVQKVKYIPTHRPIYLTPDPDHHFLSLYISLQSFAVANYQHSLLSERVNGAAFAGRRATIDEDLALFAASCTLLPSVEALKHHPLDF